MFIWLASFAFQQLSVMCSDVDLSVLSLDVYIMIAIFNKV